jgi:hypothetical protein
MVISTLLIGPIGSLASLLAATLYPEKNLFNICENST